MLNTAVLLIVFNRPETTKRVFAQIRKAEPRRLFIVADGPRKNVPADKILCEDVRRIVTTVDWDCDVRILFRNENLGLGHSVSGAISWFFEQVDEGIILEDDCLPSGSFFTYCEELLNRYREEEKIFMIGGFNAFANIVPVQYSYYFSRFPRIWGWATWKRAWKYFRYDVPEWENRRIRFRVLRKLPHIEKVNFLWYHINKIREGSMSAWSPQWFFYMLLHDRLSILPVKNLVINIGFILEATHTFPHTDNYFNGKKLEEISLPYLHPQKVEYYSFADHAFLKEKYGSASWFKKLHWKYQELSLRVKSIHSDMV